MNQKSRHALARVWRLYFRDPASPCPGLVCITGLLLALFSSTAHAGFVDATSTAGVGYTQHVLMVQPNCIDPAPGCDGDRLTGGAAVADVDQDGHPDLYVTRLDGHDLLFRNKGDGTFEDISAAAGLDAFDLQSSGAAFGDIDNDGDPDLYVTVFGVSGDSTNNRGYLFINNGGVFSEDALARGAAVTDTGGHRNFTPTFGDYDRDGWLDLHTTEWFDPLGSGETRLLRNRGSAQPGFFDDVTVSSGASIPGVAAFGSAFTDLDGDGWPDLAVVADFGTSQLLWNQGNGTFVNTTAASGVGTDENGMGSTFGDYDGDGDLDWFVTAIYDPAQTCEFLTCGWGYSGNRLYRNDGGRSFVDVTDLAGVRNGHWGWGAAFFDYDNDADLDLVMTNGVDFPAAIADNPYNADPMRLWENDGTGSMSEVSASEGLGSTGPGKGLLVADYDSDGDLDLFIVNNGGSPHLYRNDLSNGNGWLRIRTEGQVSNREGRGARVRVQVAPGGPWQIREMGTSTHFLGQSENVAHFGLGPGSAPVAAVEVTWPSGLTSQRSNVDRNSTLLVREVLELPALDTRGGWGLAGALALTFSCLAGILPRVSARPEPTSQRQEK